MNCSTLAVPKPPAGLAPDDEYDCMIAPLVGLLSADADQPALASFLRHQLRSHFGLDPVHDEIESVASRLVSWRETFSQNDPAVPTACPACCAGPEQATDPEHMRRSVCDAAFIGDDPLVDGMSLSVRLRRDFTVTDADRLLATARRMYRELNPGASAEQAGEHVAGAADALFVLLEHAGLLGDAVDGRLAGDAGDGMSVVDGGRKS